MSSSGLGKTHGDGGPRSRGRGLTDRWGEVHALFERIVDLPRGEHQAALAQASGDDPELREAVGRLLKADRAAERRGFLIGAAELDGPVNPEQPRGGETESQVGEKQPLTKARAIAAPEATDHGSSSLERIGAYRVLREIGRGGMGTIYAATRADGTLEREVAIKVIRAGAENEDVIRRMWAECQILARLEHPHIARIHDAGSTAEGLPYFVMELVDGEPIDVYCARRELDLRGRLRLVRQVCTAVEYANQRLVVHRDIKPSNILVTAAGTVKLLDFGIAKVLHEADSGPGPQTEPWRQRLTIEYASPEQLRGQPVSVACDAYSLGVLLFFLLTGETPRSADDLSPWLFDELLRSKEPPTPSALVARKLIEKKSAESVGEPPPGPPATARQLAGDVDSMVLGALQVEPKARYASARELREDIDRYLGGFPVRARHGNRLYRAGKFLRRHGRRVAAAALVVSLGLSLLASRIQAGAEAKKAELQLRNEAVKRQHVLDVFLEIFEQAGPLVAEGVPLTLVQAVDRFMERSADRFEGQPEVQATILSTLGWIYLDLGEPLKAGEFHRRALGLRRPPGPAGERTESMVGVAAALRDQGQLEDAESLSLEALAAIESAGDALPQLRLLALNHHVELKCLQGDWPAAEPFSRRAFELAETLAKELDSPAEAAFGDPESQGSPAGFSSAAFSIASSQRAQVLRRLGELEAARSLYSETIERLVERAGSEHPLLAVLHNNLAELAYQNEDYEVAIADWQLADEHYGRIYGEDYYGRIAPLNNQARALLALGREQEAEAVLRQAMQVSLDSPALGPRHEGLYFGRVAVKLSELLASSGRCSEVTALLAARYGRWKESKTKRKAEDLVRRCRES